MREDNDCREWWWIPFLEGIDDRVCSYSLQSAQEKQAVMRLCETRVSRHMTTALRKQNNR